MDTATYNSSMVNNLWNIIQGLSLSSSDQRWLANKLIEASVEPETQKKELVFPKLPKNYKPSQELLSMSLGPVPEGFDIDKELELMWEERAK